jgi:hypothetical protein
VVKKLGLGCLSLGLALLVGAALLVVLLASYTAGLHLNRDIKVSGSGIRPQLFFACELDDAPLEKLFADPALIAQLRDLDAGVALALKDFSPRRTRAVQQLNHAGIPVIAWLVLPSQQGYYLNAGNAPQAVARYRAFRQWTDENHLQWAAVGLDIEPNLSEFAALKSHRLSLFAAFLRRAFNGRRVTAATQEYSALIHEIQADGHKVQTYQFVILADERKSRSTVLERILGLVDVRGNDEVLMAYTSFNHHLDSALIWAYGPDAQVIAVGSTGSTGDPQLDARFAPLDWNELSRDLIVASHFTRVIGIYSLEGCVHQGLLTRLSGFDWNQFVTVGADSISTVKRFRMAFQIALWIASHPFIVLLLLLFGWWFVWRFLARKFASRTLRIAANSTGPAVRS